MVQRIEVTFKEGQVDGLGENVKNKIINFLGIDVDSVSTRKVFTVDAKLTEEELKKLKKELFCDPVTETTERREVFDWLIEVGYKPGVTDNVGRTAKNEAIPNVIGRLLSKHENVYTSTQYLLKGRNLIRSDAERIGEKLLANPIIENVTTMNYSEVMERGIEIKLPIIKVKQKTQVKEYNLSLSDEKLEKISKKNVWSLNLEEMKALKTYFEKSDVIEERKRIGLSKKPTDVEMEVLAQTWAEHCKHKIFNGTFEYADKEVGTVEIIDSLLKTYIMKPSFKIAEEMGWVVSMFEDNAGVVRFNDRLNVVDKIETHNAPSALEPYGGSITGIVGVNRDSMGTGKGAKLMINIFGYCFGDPFCDKELPAGVLHPRRIRDGVHKGVIDGGNQSGIPLGRGWEIFDEMFTFRPLVYCGTIGKMPVEINGEPSHKKKADPGDLIVMIGGRVGKDGIHGATFSSAELHKESPVQAVQIGDPITQKKMSDFLLEARDRGLYKCITDNGAGGLSSSVGEMAKYSNGCELDLERVPLKYQGLDPWEILLSEAQERMTLAVDPSRIDEFLELSKKRSVESTVLGKFTNSGKFHVKYGERTVTYLDMGFLHDGVPKKRLKAVWKRPVHKEPYFEEPDDINNTLEEMLSRLNICSKEYKLRQYDHEVKGLSAIKLLVGKDCDIPSDATIFFLEYGSKEGLILAEGKNPHYSYIDTYHMAASAIDEAVRRIISVGGKLPSKETVFYGLDNFCWNIADEYGPDAEYKFAQLVRANKALQDYCLGFGIPCISGKDSMKNVWKTKEIINGKEVEKTISIPPTFMFSARAKMHDVSKAITMDVKKPGDLVYVVGETFDELGGSEYYSYVGEKTRGERFIGNNVPKVDVEKSKRLYKAISKATEKEMIHSSHTPTLGGLGVALAMTAFAGGYGIDADLRKVPYVGEKRDDSVLFSESNSRFIVSVPEGKKKKFEEIMNENIYGLIGSVTEQPYLKIKGLDGNYIVDANINRLKETWKKTLSDI